MLIHAVKHPYSGTPPNVTEALSAILDAAGTGLFSTPFIALSRTTSTRRATASVQQASTLSRMCPQAWRSPVSSSAHRQFGAKPGDDHAALRSTRQLNIWRFVASMSSELNSLDNEIFTCAETLKEDVGNFFLSGYLEEIKSSDRASDGSSRIAVARRRETGHMENPRRCIQRSGSESRRAVARHVCYWLSPFILFPGHRLEFR